MDVHYRTFLLMATVMNELKLEMNLILFPALAEIKFATIVTLVLVSIII